MYSRCPNKVLSFWLVFVATFFIVFSSLAGPVLASGVSLSPIRSILNTVAGQKLEVEFTFSNNDPLARKFEVLPAQVLGEDVVTNPSISKIGWLTISHKEVALAAESSVRIKATIAVPDDAVTGSYKLLVMMREIVPVSQQGVGTSVNLAAAYPIEINVINELPRGNLQAFIDVSPSFSLEDKFTVDIDIQNVGNISLYPILYLKVFNPRGDVIFQQTLNTEQLALPAKNSIKQDFEFKVSNGDVLASTGEYTAEIIALDNQLQISAKQAQKFLYIPAMVALVALILAVVVIVAVTKIARSLVRKVVLRRKES